MYRIYGTTPHNPTKQLREYHLLEAAICALATLVEHTTTYFSMLEIYKETDNGPICIIRFVPNGLE